MRPHARYLNPRVGSDTSLAAGIAAAIRATMGRGTARRGPDGRGLYAACASLPRCLRCAPSHMGAERACQVCG